MELARSQNCSHKLGEPSLPWVGRVRIHLKNLSWDSPLEPHLCSQTQDPEEPCPLSMDTLLRLVAAVRSVGVAKDAQPPPQRAVTAVTFRGLPRTSGVTHRAQMALCGRDFGAAEPVGTGW